MDALLAELVRLRGEPAPEWAGRIENPPKPAAPSR
jgi:hypothetical protein